MAEWNTISLLSTALLVCGATAPADTKQHSVFFPQNLLDRARRNAEVHPREARLRDQLIADAQPWVALSDDALWHLMFGPNITRSWMVWSNGHCPSCSKNVPMYEWETDPLVHPWKVRCPQCDEFFPKNDFRSFYRSGLDEHNVFQPKKADRALLFNAEHPDPAHPLHGFGVDDGEGYVAGKDRWRFIGAYLIYGQWKQAVLGGIKRLAEAYVVTGDTAYAHKAGILLDRVADLYPTFDYKTQALVYEKRLGSNGYVSVWHDACEETRELALAYDQVFEGLRGDNVLIHFLAGKAKEFKLENPKRSFADVQNNIEGRILRDALANQHKIASNYPRTPIAVAVTKAVLDWPRSRDEVLKLIDAFLKRSTAVDGVTGEKGLANYSAFGLQSIALFLADWDRAIPGFLDDIVRRNPALHSMFRFHIDTWCLNSYYPLSGDTGWFAKRIDQYQGVRFQRFGLESDYSHKDAAISPSMFTFMWRLYELTGDAAFVQALYMANDYSVEGLPHDVFADGHEALQEAVREVIRREGAAPGTTSIDKQRWHLAILRSGTDSHGRAAWLDYDSGGGHSHQDGMNVGLFAYGLDLMPDFGYPPVQFGGWGSAKATWYKQSAAHNTVVIDGANHGNAAGRTTLWAIGESLQCVRASGAAIVAGAKQFERTVATVGCASNDFYMIDVFRVVGGMDHAKFMHSHFGRITTNGLALVPTTSYGAGMQMRRVAVDAAPKPGWWVDWDIEDRYKLLPHEADVHLRYTDLTAEAQAYTAEGWVAAGGYDTNEEAWIPRVITRRTGASAPLASTFVAVVEPYTDSPNIAGVRRLSVAGADGTPYGDTGVAVELDLADGSAHLVLAADVENAVESTPSFPDDRAMVQADWGVRTDAEFCLICRFPDGTPERLVFCNGSFIEFGGVKVVAGASASELAEIAFEDGVPRVVGGAPDQVLRFYRDGTEILVRNAH